MTDNKKPEELKDEELDQASGGFSFGVEREVKNPGGDSKIKKPQPKGMERVFEDE